MAHLVTCSGKKNKALSRGSKREAEIVPATFERQVLSGSENIQNKHWVKPWVRYNKKYTELPSNFRHFNCLLPFVPPSLFPLLSSSPLLPPSSSLPLPNPHLS